MRSNGILLSIDPGTTESAYCLIEEETYKPIEFGKIDNESLLEKMIMNWFSSSPDDMAIEMIASYGMPVGKEVFETCVWIGRFIQAMDLSPVNIEFVYRQEEKLMLCHSVKAGDANIHRALIDRFAKHDLKSGKGTKKNPDWFYGFAKDVWAAYSVGIVFIDRRKEANNGKV